ncbi:PAS domain S-box protein [Gloeothece verrucosa]|uniref:histidine kinase n=1 Tax=Gloeothece verrucosa (strain PCC 7822) TaxID=497965 RepID=E0ULQ8_GLOV7|nr:PAS domain S-box protein [Gloeothece verrucosa]ADN17888.1 multi-sensor signal transduction histidine kinase [Gloeothece verrucosa PCC 7822]
MNDLKKTKAQLLAELKELRTQVATLKSSSSKGGDHSLETLHQTFQAETEHQGQWQQQRQQLIYRTALLIRQSLKLEEIFDTTVTEIRNIIKSDRLIIYQFLPDRCGIVVAESVSEPVWSIKGQIMPEETFPYDWVAPYQQGRTRAMNDIYTDPHLSQCHVEFLEFLRVRANLIAPILHQNSLWGLLIAHQCSTPRQWTASEVDLMKELAIQVAIAIQQALLVRQQQEELIRRREIETELRQQTQLLDLSDEAIIALNINRKIIYWNRGAERLYGWTKEEALGQKIESMLQTQFPISLEAAHQTIIEQEYWEGELLHIRRDGQPLIVESRQVLQRDSKGNPEIILETNRDLTRRKQLEENLKINEERLRLTLELTGIGSWDFNLKTEAFISSDNVFRMSGLDPKTAAPSYALWLEQIHSDDRERVEQKLQEAIQNQTPLEVKYRVVHPKGHICWILSKASFICDQTGQATRMLGIWMDITAQKETEFALKQGKETLKLFFKYVPAGVVVVDRNMCYLMASQRWLDDYKISSDDTLQGHSLYQIVPEIPPKWRQIHQLCVKGATEKCDEELFIRSDGTEQWLRWEIVPWYDNLGKEAGIIIFTENISERKQAEIALQELNSQLEQRIIERTEQLQRAKKNIEQELLERKKLERELRKREQLLDGFFNAASDAKVGMCINDLNFRFLKINQALADINGYSIEDHLGRNLDDVLPELAPTLKPLWENVIDSNQPINLEISAVVPSSRGVMRYWSVAYFPILAENENLIGIGAVVIEITESKRLELEQAKLIEILEATPDIIATASSATQKVGYCNQALRKLLGVAPNSPVTDLTIADVYPQWAYSMIQNEGIPTAIREGIWRGETAFLGIDGEEIPFSQVIIAHTFGTEAVQSVSTIARDISEQKQKEAILRESDRRWQSLLNNIKLIVVGLDLQGNVEYVNPFFLSLTEYTEPEILGKNWFNQFLPADIQTSLTTTIFRELLEQEKYIYYQNPILTSSGEERLIAWTNTVLRDANEQPIGTVSIGQDITESEKLARMKDEFISVVSHELRTPLTSLQAALSLLYEKIIDPTSDEGQETIEIATEGVNRLVRLVNDILDLERLSSGKIRLEKQFCQTDGVILAALDQIKEIAKEAQIIIKSEYENFFFWCDSDRLVQILINLLNNAIKFSPQNSIIELKVQQQNSPMPSLLFSISDQGRGIPSDKLESIFDRFGQVDASDSRAKGGTGLGLAICRSIVTQHGGEIWVNSKLGQGSTFYFTIPLNKH